MIVALAASPAAAVAQSTLHRILEAGEIRVGTIGDWNPMTVRDPATNTYQGFDVDVVTELAKDLGVRQVFVFTEWKTLVRGMVAGKYDISTSASVTPSRIRTVGFTRSYFQVGTVSVKLKKDIARFAGWDDINRADVRVVVEYLLLILVASWLVRRLENRLRVRT